MTLARSALRAVVCLLVSFTLFSCDAGSPTPAGPEVALSTQALSSADCPAGYRVIRGTEAGETLNGTSGNDCIIALGGNDTIYGNGGNDYIAGGDGNDTIFGGAGNDAIYGEAGADVLHGEAGTDTIDGGDGDDLANGGIGQDTLLGGPGRDRLNGGDTEDVLRGGPDDDTLHGDAANDQLFGDDGDDVLDGDANADTLWGGNGDDALYGDIGNDILNGEAGDDALIGGAGTNTINGGAGIDACSGTGCERPQLNLSGCSADAQCTTGQRCIADFGLCLGCVADQDGDRSCDSKDGCPNDAAKTSAGVCGCGVSDADSDGDGSANCVDGCPSDPAKQSAGVCGCGVSDTNGDGDAAPDCSDGCPTDPAKTSAGACGCGVSDADSDSDSSPDCLDGCPADANKTAPGVCGCGVGDLDSDGDGRSDCQDSCPADAHKVAPGACGCGVSDLDSDADGRADCIDVCPGFDDAIDLDADSVPDGCDVPTDCTYETVGIGVHRGDLVIDSDDDLAGLSNVTCVAGSLYVMEAVTSLHGLESLHDVAGFVSIWSTQLVDLDGLEGLARVGSGMSIRMNTMLTQIDALEGLTSIAGALEISLNPSLASIRGLSNLTSLATQPSEPKLSVWQNASLPACQVWEIELRTGTRCDNYCGGNTGSTSCGELPPDFACVPGATGPGVFDGDVYLATHHVPNLGGVTCITGSLSVMDQGSLRDLVRLQKVGGSVWLSSLAVSDLSELSQLREIGGALTVSNNAELRDISALDGLTQVGGGAQGLSVWFNPLLPACQAWRLGDRLGKPCNTGAWSCSGNTGEGSCGDLPDDFACVPGAVGPGVFDGWLYGTPNLREFGGLRCVTGSVMLSGPQDLTALQGLQEIGGSLSLYNLTLSDLSPFAQLREVGGDVAINGNEALISAAGLERLRQLHGRLDVSYNPLLRDLSALSQTSGATSINISYNQALPACQAWGIAGRSGLACGSAFNQCTNNTGSGACGSLPTGFQCVPGAVGPGVYDGPIYPNGHATNEFSGLTCVTGDLVLGDNLASDLGWLSGLEQVGGNLSLVGQPINSLSGLEQLHTVGGRLMISNNWQLASLSPLAQLTSVGRAQPGLNDALDVSFNPEVPACEVLTLANRVQQPCPFDRCYGNTGTGSCASLPDDFACVPGAIGPGVYDGSVSLWGSSYPEGLRGVTCITGDLTLASDPPNLDVFSALQKVGGSLSISYTNQLTNIDALSRLTAVGSNLSITSNFTLSSLSGLRNLTTLGGSGFIAYNSALAPCWLWDLRSRFEQRVDGYANDGSGRCGALPADFRCEPGARGLGVWDGDVYGGMLAMVSGATCITGNLMVSSTSYTDLSALEYLQMVGGNFDLTDNAQLASVDGLENLTSIGGSLRIERNAALGNLLGLSSLAQLGQTSSAPNPLQITLNEALPACWGAALEQQTGVMCGDGETPPYACWGNTGSGSCAP